MQKALGENKAKYTHAGSMLLAPQERGASGGRSDFNISNQCREEEWQKKGWKQIHGAACLRVRYHLSILPEDTTLNLAFLISVSINEHCSEQDSHMVGAPVTLRDHPWCDL